MSNRPNPELSFNPHGFEFALSEAHEHQQQLYFRTQRVVDAAAMLIYPDLESSRMTAQYSADGKPTLNTWDSLMIGWADAQLATLRHANSTYTYLDAAGALPHTQIKNTETPFIANARYQKGLYDQTVDPSGLLASDSQQLEPDSMVRRLSEIHVRQLYAQHRRLRLVLNPFCTNPALSEPAIVNGMIDTLLKESEGVLLHHISPDRKTSEMEIAARKAALPFDSYQLLHSAAYRDAAIEALKDQGATRQLAKKVIGSSIYSYQLNFLADELAIDAVWLQRAIVENERINMSTETELTRAQLLADIYRQAIRQDIKEFSHRPLPEDRLVRMGLHVLGVIQRGRALALGKMASAKTSLASSNK